MVPYHSARVFRSGQVFQDDRGVPRSARRESLGLVTGTQREAIFSPPYPLRCVIISDYFRARPKLTILIEGGHMADSNNIQEKLLKAAAWVLGTLLVAGLAVAGWIGKQVWEMNGKLTETSNRVERIVAVLPDLRVKIAREEVESPILFACAFSQPYEESSETWGSVVTLFDTRKKLRSTYRVALSHANDFSYAYEVLGMVLSSGDDVLTFDKLENASLEFSTPISTPSYIQAKYSFVLRTASRDYKKELEILLSAPPTKETPFTRKLNGWKDLSDELRGNSAEYQRK